MQANSGFRVNAHTKPFFTYESQNPEFCHSGVFADFFSSLAFFSCLPDFLGATFSFFFSEFFLGLAQPLLRELEARDLRRPLPPMSLFETWVNHFLSSGCRSLSRLSCFKAEKSARSAIPRLAPHRYSFLPKLTARGRRMGCRSLGWDHSKEVTLTSIA